MFSDRLPAGRCTYEREDPNGALTVRFSTQLSTGTKTDPHTIYPEDTYGKEKERILDDDDRLRRYLENQLADWVAEVTRGRPAPAGEVPKTAIELVQWWRKFKSGRLDGTPTNRTPDYVEGSSARLGLVRDGESIGSPSFLDVFGHRHPDTLTREEVFKNWLWPRTQQGATHKITWRSAKNIHDTIRQVWGDALEEGMVKVAPPSPKKFPPMDRFHKQESRKRALAKFWPTAELDAFRHGVEVVRDRYLETEHTGIIYTKDGRDCEMSPFAFERIVSMIEFAVRFGARPDEICGLHDDVINRRTGQLSIEAALVSLYSKDEDGEVDVVRNVLGPTKTGESALYPIRILQGQLDQWLRERQRMVDDGWFHDGAGHKGFLFPKQTGGPVSDRTFRDDAEALLQAMEKDPEIPGVRYISPYGFRHTCAVHLLLHLREKMPKSKADDVGRQYIQDFLRHTNYGTTQKYVKWADQITGLQADVAISALGTDDSEPPPGPKTIRPLEDLTDDDVVDLDAERRKRAS